MIVTCINEICMENFNEYAENIKKVAENVEEKCDKCKYYKNKKCENNLLCIENNLFKKNEEKQYLKTWEAIKAMEEGKKVRNFNWIENCYINIKNNKIVSDLDIEYIISDRDIIYSKWEIYEENKKEIPKEFEGLKYLLASINNMNCDKQNCDNCPLGIDNCNTLDDIFFDVKQNYNF